MYKTLYNMCVDRTSVLDNKKFSNSYFPKSLEERLGLSKQRVDSNKEKVEKEKREEKKEKREEKKEKDTKMESGVCSVDSDGIKHICGSDSGSLYPILDPRFNLREACKNMILLEDHLFHTGKRCHDCILKHAMTIEAFLEEGITLDKKREYKRVLEDSFKDFREIFNRLVKYMNSNKLGDDECNELAQSIRKIRKPLCQNYATFLDN